ncbi:MAG TPA: hypothetical protein VK604_08790 [Bryobacteraceae bacterium]|nr:hypothetical protein [Bryobacteraceae bacterium]
MATPAASKKTVPLTPLLIGLVVIVALIAGLGYLNKPAAKKQVEVSASAEARAYLSHLELSDVAMQATENFMQQRVVEVQGKIGNKGPRALASVDVYCLFYGVDGREIHRERLPIVGGTSAASERTPLQPGDTRAFRLPFDSLPEGWNQTMPKLVIAQIAFAN